MEVEDKEGPGGKHPGLVVLIWTLWTSSGLAWVDRPMGHRSLLSTQGAWGFSTPESPREEH